MSTKDMVIERDLENDVLYVFKNGIDLSKTKNYTIDADIVVRVSPDNGEVVGLTIEDFSETFPHIKDYPDYRLMEIFDDILPRLLSRLQVA